jgi:hypothetical protein
VAERLFRRSTSNVWYASYYDTNGKRQTRSTKQLDKRAAAATLREWERRAADPAYAASHQATLEEALRGVLRDRKLKGRAEGTLDCYRVKAATSRASLVQNCRCERSPQRRSTRSLIGGSTKAPRATPSTRN